MGGFEILAGRGRTKAGPDGMNRDGGTQAAQINLYTVLRKEPYSNVSVANCGLLLIARAKQPRGMIR